MYREVSETDFLLVKDKLKPKYQVVLQAHIDGKMYKNIALEIGCPIGTVRSRMNRARLEMKKALLDREVAEAWHNTEAANAEKTS